MKGIQGNQLSKCTLNQLGLPQNHPLFCSRYGLRQACSNGCMLISTGVSGQLSSCSFDNPTCRFDNPNWVLKAWSDRYYRQLSSCRFDNPNCSFYNPTCHLLKLHKYSRSCDQWIIASGVCGRISDASNCIAITILL